MTPVSSATFGLNALTAMIAIGGPLNGCKVHLYTNNIVPFKGILLAAFTEANYTGYAAVAVGSWGMPYVDTDTLATIAAPSIQFQPTDAVVPNTIYGAFVTNTAGTVLEFAVKFDTPVPLPDQYHAAVYEPQYKYGA